MENEVVVGQESAERTISTPLRDDGGRPQWCRDSWNFFLNLLNLSFTNN